MRHHAHKDTNSVAMALLMIVLGVMFFMGTSLLWPAFILIPGLIMVSMAPRSGPVGAAALSIPGALLAGLGGLMFVQNLTGYWASWAYAWTLIPVFAGWGMHIMARALHEPDLDEVASWTVKGGLIAFAIFAIFFEFMIGLGGIGSGGAALLILVGLFLLARAFTGQPQLASARDGAGDDESFFVKPKRKRKFKHHDALFAGPIIVGSRGKRTCGCLRDNDSPDSERGSARE